jgi:hypothetical protein
MTELERMKWQIYFSHLTESTNWACNDEKEKNSEGENKGDKYDQLEANLNKSGHELRERNFCVYDGKMTEKTLHATNASAEDFV